MDVSIYPPDIAHLFNSLSAISPVTFQVVSNVFFGLAAVSTVARILLKIYEDRRFSFDDYILFFATICQFASSILLNLTTEFLYLNGILLRFPSLAKQLNDESFSNYLRDAWIYQTIIFGLTQVTIYAVKCSFLAFFWPLVTCSNSKHLKRYFWTVVVVMIPVGIGSILSPLKDCPQYDAATARCIHRPTRLEARITTGLLIGLDGFTDLLVCSIPIAILWPARIKLSQKIGIGTFLCLSSVMIFFSVMRVFNVNGLIFNSMDIPWSYFAVHLESCISVILISITVFRSIFGMRKEREQARARRLRPNSWYWSGGRGRIVGMEEDEKALPDVETGVLEGLRAFIQEYGKSETREIPVKHRRVDDVHLKSPSITGSEWSTTTYIEKERDKYSKDSHHLSEFNFQFE
ncbi:hypothetical protein BS50DRAFT_410490 [Corynespora cassiicola Philippines]|uniref:Rhodopsin domain-containing protein n=1 Tax=Corynespora cassiicola Philippines TaxID=1448308 RepID=A0A2T2NMH0_CORCC|nr:hypothetical protein BS50DRAFT_410490 [Corynespora cassiicola Philippines]